MTKACIFLIVCLLVATGAVFAAEAPAASGMDTPITLAVKGEALSDVVQNLKTQSGVNLTVAKDIADLKVTVFVDKQPLSNIIAGLKTLFHFEWYKKEYNGKNIYELSKSLRNKKDTFDELDFDAIQQQLDKKLAAMNDKIQPSATKADETSKAAAVMILGFSPELKNALIQGYTVCLDSSSSDAQWQTPESLSNSLKKTFARENKDIDSSNTESSHSRIRLSITAPIKHKDDTTEITFIAWIHLEQNQEVESSYTNTTRKLFPDGIELDIPIPPDYLPHDDLPITSSKPLIFTNDEISKESGLVMASGTNEGVPANRSDLLALLHEKTGAQIIADHYSQWSDWSNTTNKSLNDLLQMIAKKNLESYWGSDGRFIYMRAIDLQKWNIEETPNRILEPLQKFADEQGYLDIDQIAVIMMLGERKATALQNNAMYLRLPANFNQSIYQNESIRQALIFYGSLNPLQKKAILNSRLDVASLTPKQHAAVAGCLNCITSVLEPSKRVVVGIYENGVRIDRPEPPSPDDPIKIRMTAQIDSSAITPELYMTIRKPTDSAENVLKVAGYTLEFEFQNGSIQKIIIPVMGKPVN